MSKIMMDTPWWFWPLIITLVLLPLAWLPERPSSNGFGKTMVLVFITLAICLSWGIMRWMPR